MQKAIVCLDSEKSTLSMIEQIVLEHFGQEYVVEIAEKPSEAIEVIQMLKGIKVDTAVFITNLGPLDGESLDLQKKICEMNKLTKNVLLTGQLEALSTEVINSNHIFKIIKKTSKREDVIQIIKDALYAFDQETELESLYAKLKASENEKKLILESIAEGMLLIDGEYNIMWMNEIVKNEFNEGQDFLQQKCYEFFHNIARPCKDCQWNRALTSLKSHSIERKFRNEVYKNVKYYPVSNNEGKALGILMSLTDITNQKKVDKMNNVLLEIAKSVNHSEAILQLYQHIYEAIVNDLSAKYMCVAGRDFDNVYIEYLNGKDKLICYKKLKPKEYDHALNLMNILSNQIKVDSKNNYLITENGNEVEIAMNIHDKVMIFMFENSDMSVDYLLTFVKSLSEQIKTGITRIESIKKITYQAHHDSLTGLYNREFFMKTVNSKIFTQRESDRDVKQYSLAVLDLNYFKEVNDTYGHVFGDEVLFTVSQRILQSLRHGDIVARIGGDEFAILLQLVSKTEVTKILDRVQEMIAMPIRIGKADIQVGSSIGLVYEVSKYSNSELVLKDADAAMYEAKKDKTGVGSCRFFEKDIEERLQHLHFIKSSLKTAVINDEFSVRYQPIVCLKDYKVVGFEAFIRWENSKGVFYNPQEFIPIAEDSGDIENIGNFVLDQVDEAIDVLNAEGEECYISINFSSKQLLSSQQLNKIENLGLNAKCIQIDVNEKALFENHNKANISLDKLQKMGIKIHLDDFGTGYSSLSYLNNTEINDIKIDSTFVAQLGTNLNCSNVVKIILSVAATMGMTVTAEGVETKDQLELLKQMGCDFVQGYYISMPLTLQEAVAFKQEWGTNHDFFRYKLLKE